MAPITVAATSTDPDTTEPKEQLKKTVVGIIYPPPEIRNIVDKTASFVARNGPEFENRIRANEASNPKFNFLNPKDPYHAYYQHKVREFQEGKAAESQKSGIPTRIQEAVKAHEFIPKDPPSEFEFVAEPATISSQELDLIKLTAQFVAKNGRSFLAQIMGREGRNFQFDFLKPQHSSFPYFTKLVEQYTKVLIPPRDVIIKLSKEASNSREVYDMIKYRVEWERFQRRLRERQEAEAEKERAAFASIDWHDFVVVQTVDFQPHEQVNLPPPCTPKDVGARILAQQRAEAAKTVEAMEMEMDESDSDDDHPKKDRPSSPKGAQPVPLPPRPENVLVRKGYDPKAARAQVERVKATDQKLVISPLTGERIPADKLAEHMRLNTIDRDYFKQREVNAEGMEKEEPVFAAGTDIMSNIKHFAERRTDIFGKGAEETAVGRKIGEEREKDSGSKIPIWDGHASTIDTVQKAAAAAIAAEEIAKYTSKSNERIGPQSVTSAPAQIRLIEAPKPPPMQTVTHVVPIAVAPQMVVLPAQSYGIGMVPLAFNMNMQQMDDEEDEPASKRQKSEEQLVPEQEFLRTNRGPVEVLVQMPSMAGKTEWALNGQVLRFMMPLNETIATIKTKVQETIGMPTTKQKLTFDGMFPKDQNSLAFYNMVNGSIVYLQLKERGGRKK